MTRAVLRPQTAARRSAHPAPAIWLGVLIALALGLLIPLASQPAAHAQFLSLDEGSGPLELEADGALEWRADDQQYVATGGVFVRQGDATLRTQTLVADYRTDENGDTVIWRITAEGGVTIESADARVTGGRGVYNLEEERFTLTGGPLRLETGDETLTADESMQYDQRAGVAIARGNAVVERENERLSADVLRAEMGEGADGEQEVTFVTAEGGVEVTSPDGNATADRGEYDLSTNIARLSGNVVIMRGQTRLTGAGAEVNLDTGVSRLTAGDSGDGRIRGLLIPESGN